MNIGRVSIEDKTINELMLKTGSESPIEAIDKAIRFTLLHDKDSIRDALYELVEREKGVGK